MASITPSIPPGSYLEQQSVTFSFAPNVTSVAFTQDTAPPSISKYISYDTLTPPNPFIAVTEDGRGRVVYDGGFPKFYNSPNSGAATTFAELTSAGKYLYNALNWIANPNKVAGGNKKVLVLGDDKIGGNYPIKSSISSGFHDTVVKICAVAGYTPTFMDVDDFDGVNLNPTLATLEQYCCVLFFSTKWTDVALITASAINDLVTYRENGNGICFITDHGYNLAKIEDVNIVNGAFFKTGNAVVSRFGAYFTGNYDRTPVNVGFLRQNYGDHPLYAGLLDSDSMPAGASESRVVVTQTATVAPGAFAPVTVSKNGLNAVNVLVTLADGSVETARYVYNIQGDEFIFVQSTPFSNPGNPETNQGKVYAAEHGALDYAVSFTPGNLGTVWGEILLNNKRIGELYGSGTTTQVFMYGGGPSKTFAKQGDKLDVVVRVPFTYIKSSTVQRELQLSNPSSTQLHAVLKDFCDTFGFDPSLFRGKRSALKQIFNKINTYFDSTMHPVFPTTVSGIIKMVRDFNDNRLQFLDGLVSPIYATTAAAQAAVAAAPANPGSLFIDAQTNTVYAYKDGVIQPIVGLKAQDFLGSPRLITSSVDNKKYKLTLDGKITAVS